jgi:hypothetical protein
MGWFIRLGRSGRFRTSARNPQQHRLPESATEMIAISSRLVVVDAVPANRSPRKLPWEQRKDQGKWRRSSSSSPMAEAQMIETA